MAGGNVKWAALAGAGNTTEYAGEFTSGEREGRLTLISEDVFPRKPKADVLVSVFASSEVVSFEIVSGVEVEFGFAFEAKAGVSDDITFFEIRADGTLNYRAGVAGEGQTFIDRDAAAKVFSLDFSEARNLRRALDIITAAVTWKCGDEYAKPIEKARRKAKSALP